MWSQKSVYNTDSEFERPTPKHSFIPIRSFSILANNFKLKLLSEIEKQTDKNEIREIVNPKLSLEPQVILGVLSSNPEWVDDFLILLNDR